MAKPESLWRDAKSFVAYYIYMTLPWSIAQHCNWMLPSVGDWAYREERLAAQDTP